MVRKRPHDEIEGVHSSRREQVYGSMSKPVKKPRKNGPPPSQFKQAHDSSVNAIKKRIRDVTRRLARLENLPADIRVEDERALAAYRQELAAAEEESIKQKMIKKYHMVRFFERKKATKQNKKLRKRLLEAPTTDEVEKIKELLHVAEVDLNYTQYYPLNEVYVGLYATDGSSPDNKDVAHSELESPGRLKPPMWTEIERRMEEGGLDELRNGIRKPLITRQKGLKPTPKSSVKQQGTQKSNREEKTGKRGVAMSKESYKSRRAKDMPLERVLNEGDDEEVGDGGFFEE